MEVSAPRRGKVAGIEAARGVAAVLVILYHVSFHIFANFKTSVLFDLFHFGHSGVDLFFTISGFIILYVHWDDVGRRDRVRHYAWRRFTRLMPTYWIALIISTCMTGFGHHGWPSEQTVLWSITLLPANTNLIMGIAWTLRLEVFFYMYFAVLITNLRIGLVLLAAWLVLVVTSATLGVRAGGLAGEFTASFDLSFFMGMLVAYLLRATDFVWPSRLWIAGLVLFALTAACEDLGLINGYLPLARLCYGVPSAIIILGLAANERGRIAQIPRVLQNLGAASYSLYLFQFVFIGVLWHLLRITSLSRHLPPSIQFVLLAGAAVVGGLLTHRFVEKPLMRACRSMGRRTWSRPGDLVAQERP